MVPPGTRPAVAAAITDECDASMAETPNDQAGRRHDPVVVAENGGSEAADSLGSVQFTASYDTSFRTWVDRAMIRLPVKNASSIGGTQHAAPTVALRLRADVPLVPWSACGTTTPTSDFRRW